ncbi:hypothetical protein [Streptomyces sp. NPDC002133]|uniref:hypothetical protein n=1 Tax=Streptomyces sp. NPDC002133 TaxID=3154409 RepID=UPI00332AA050
MAVGGPALFLGADTPCVALVRPELDVNDPGLRLAAERAGVSPEEFAGPEDTWQMLADRADGESRGFVLPGFAVAEAAAFADALLTALDGDADFALDLADGALGLEGRTRGDDRVALLARVTSPDGGEDPLELELGALPVADLRDELEDFRRSLA